MGFGSKWEILIIRIVTNLVVNKVFSIFSVNSCNFLSKKRENSILK